MGRSVVYGRTMPLWVLLLVLAFTFAIGCSLLASWWRDR